MTNNAGEQAKEIQQLLENKYDGAQTASVAANNEHNASGGVV